MPLPIEFIPWSDLRESPELLHGLVKRWKDEGNNDPTVLGLIERYHFYQCDAGLTVQESINFKRDILHGGAEIQSKFGFGMYKWVAAFVVIALSIWWFWGREVKRTWSFRDEGIPQYMDSRVSMIDWPEINFSFRKGDFDHTLDLLSSAQLFHKNNDTLNYYRAYCFLEMNQRDSANYYFSKVKDVNGIYGDRARYFLIHLDSNEITAEALSSLLKVDDPILRSAVRKDIEGCKK